MSAYLDSLDTTSGDALRMTDIASRVPDPMIGAQHDVTVGRNKRGATLKVGRRGMATVQGDTAWDTDKLAEHIGERASGVAAWLASDKLARVRKLTLGASTLDVTRAADAILHALDVDALTGTDVSSWSDVATLDNVEHDEGTDAMTQAVRCGDALDTLVALSRHRSGIAGYLAADALSFTSVNAADAGQCRGAASAWRDHGLAPSQLRCHVSLSDLADVHVPTVETAGWPVNGPASARPRVPTWRKSERDHYEQVERGDVTHWVDVATGKLVGRSPRMRGKVKPLCERDAKLSHSPESVCAECEHRDAVNAAAERVHVGNTTVDRGTSANAPSGSRRPGKRSERARIAAERQERIAEIPTVDLNADPEWADVDSTLESLTRALEPGASLRFVRGGIVASVKRTGTDGKYSVRAEGRRLTRNASADRASEVLAIALT